MSEYAEHDKLELVKERSQACGEFLEWLNEQGYYLGFYHEHNEACFNPDGVKTYRLAQCGLSESQLVRAPVEIQKLLAKFFEIDLAKLNEEKCQLLERVRVRHEG